MKGFTEEEENQYIEKFNKIEKDFAERGLLFTWTTEDAERGYMRVTIHGRMLRGTKDSPFAFVNTFGLDRHHLSNIPSIRTVLKDYLELFGLPEATEWSYQVFTPYNALSEVVYGISKK